MSERWQREVRNLRGVAPTPDLWDEATGRTPGPEHGDDRPSTRQRLVAGIVAFAVFIGAGIFAWQAFQPLDHEQPANATPTAVVITLTATEQEPTAIMSFDDAYQAALFEGYSWCSTPEDCTSVTRDLDYPPIDRGIAVPIGTPIRFEGDARVERLVIRTTEGDPASRNVVLDSDGSDVSVPEVPADYLIWVAADWDQGSGAFYVRVQVTPPPPAEPGAISDILAIECTDAGTIVQSPVVQAQNDGVHFAVDDRAGADEVLIAPVGEATGRWGADIDLSSDTSPIIRIAPEALVVGCVSDAEMPTGAVKDWPALPGMVPVTVLDPAGGYVSSELQCSSNDRRSGTTSLAEAGPFASGEEAIRDLVIGIEESDLLEPVGYPDQRDLPFEKGGGYRVVRGGSVIAAINLSMFRDGSPVIVDIEACDGSGIEGAPALGP